MIGCDWLDIMEEVVPPLRSLAAFSHAKVHLSRGDVVCIPKNSEIQEMKFYKETSVFLKCSRVFAGSQA